jgi:cell wall-associated NlpC family hydrolase
VNIRAEASTSSEILGLAEAGSKFTRTMVSGAWSKISYNGQDAYIKSEFLTTEAPAAETQPAEEPKEEETTSSAGVTEWYDTVYATTAVNVRSGAGTGYSRLGMLYAGESVERTVKTDNGWSRVNYNGQEAYINSDYLTTEEPVQESSDDETVSVGSSSETSSLGQEIANFALQYVGYPYVYGGNSLTNGVDCSGFAQQVYLHFGYSIPRRASIQATVGTSVSISNLQPGDLVFYGDSTGVGHVTIYIGNGQVVHASTPTKGIIISDMNYRTPMCAKRII